MKKSLAYSLALLMLSFIAAPAMGYSQLTVGGWTVNWSPGMACVGSPTTMNATMTGASPITSPTFLWRVFDGSCWGTFFMPCEYYTSSISHTFTADSVFLVGLVIRDAITYDSVNFTFTILVDGACTGSDFVSGKVYLDLNANGVEDAGDVNSVYQSISAPPYGPFGSSNLTGTYGFYLPGGSYAIGCNPPSLAWTVSDPPGGTYPIVLPGGGGGASGINFGLAPVGTINDLSVSTGISGTMSPGSTKKVGASVSNVGNTMLSGSVELALDADLAYLSSSPGAVYWSGGSPVIGPGTYSAGTHTVTFPFTDLPPFAMFHVNVDVLIPAATPIGTAIMSTATVNPIAGDANPADNVDTGPSITVGPYDPNDKLVTPAGTGPAGIVPPDTRLTYCVRFQNTGTWYANSVIVRDTIDGDLDPTSFEMRGASHAYSYVLDGNVLQVGFYGIMLPDSGMDEPGSHGYLTYSISPKAGLPLGSQATNDAAIYFDFNPAIVTNTTVTTFDSVTTVKVQQAGKELQVFPNPVNGKGIIRVVGGESLKYDLRVIDVNGKVLRTQQNQMGAGIPFQREDLPNGLYLIRLDGEDGSVLMERIVLQ